jgi:hypothetical protein
MDETPAVERNKPEDRNMAGVAPSPGFDLESYISNYSGRFVVVLVVLPLTNYCFRRFWR